MYQRQMGGISLSIVTCEIDKFGDQIGPLEMVSHDIEPSILRNGCENGS